MSSHCRSFSADIKSALHECSRHRRALELSALTQLWPMQCWLIMQCPRKLSQTDRAFSRNPPPPREFRKPSEWSDRDSASYFSAMQSECQNKEFISDELETFRCSHTSPDYLSISCLFIFYSSRNSCNLLSLQQTLPLHSVIVMVIFPEASVFRSSCKIIWKHLIKIGFLLVTLFGSQNRLWFMFWVVRSFQSGFRFSPRLVQNIRWHNFSDFRLAPLFLTWIRKSRICFVIQ